MCYSFSFAVLVFEGRVGAGTAWGRVTCGFWPWRLLGHLSSVFRHLLAFLSCQWVFVADSAQTQLRLCRAVVYWSSLGRLDGYDSGRLQPVPMAARSDTEGRPEVPLVAHFFSPVRLMLSEQSSDVPTMQHAQSKQPPSLHTSLSHAFNATWSTWKVAALVVLIFAVLGMHVVLVRVPDPSEA